MDIETGAAGRDRLDRISIERVIGTDARGALDEPLRFPEILALLRVADVSQVRLVAIAIAARVRHGSALPLMRIAASELRRFTLVTAFPSEPSAWSGNQVSPAGNGIVTAVESA